MVPSRLSSDIIYWKLPAARSATFLVSSPEGQIHQDYWKGLGGLSAQAFRFSRLTFPVSWLTLNVIPDA